jgi:cell wall-associated NlpC family hydrolase
MRIIALLFLALTTSCKYYNGKIPTSNTVEDSTEMVQAKAEVPANVEKQKPIPVPTNTNNTTGNIINTGNTKPEQLLTFANSLIGVKYRYGSSDPVNGFDCSGFITYVFNHFNIAVPRSSIDFTHYNTQIDIKQAKPGDLILFTGTDSTIREVGHMGIINSVHDDQVEFIHSSSGKANGVTITPLNVYYLGRFVKVIRVFNS